MSSKLMEKDDAARRLALSPKQSFIVQAPAGSGKTELLIQRFLTLLQYAETPEEILAITFTKKAANEMRMRIIKALKFAQTESEPESLHAKQTWQLAKNVLLRDQQLNWQLINNPNQLRIQTIDALCTYLTKQLPLLSHFGSQPAIAENPVFLYIEAVQEVLLHVEEDYAWSQAIAQLLLHLDNDLNKLHMLLIDLLAKRDQWLNYIHMDMHDDEIRQQLELHLVHVVEDKMRQVQQAFPVEYVAETMAIMRFAASNLLLQRSQSPITHCHNLFALPAIDANELGSWKGLAKLLLTQSGTWRKRVDAEIGFPALSQFKNASEKALHVEYRERLNALIAQLSEHETLSARLDEIVRLPDAIYNDNQWDILKSLITVLKVVTAQLRLTFQKHGQIDFIENVQAALLALGNEEAPTDLALALDYHIQHILVDEFQDTSYTQYHLLSKLTTGWFENDGRTLFVVGDPMQSIYRFRQAEVGLFIQMKTHGLGALKLTSLVLNQNFRSDESIVNWNNKHYQAIFPRKNDISTGSVSYSASIATQNLATQSCVQIHAFINANKDQQAQKIIEQIKQILQDHPNEKIAILVRSRSHLMHIIPKLKFANIPYTALDIDPLATQQYIQDLFSLTQALLNPADRIAWLSILRAPWCGLTLNDLLIVAGENSHATIWELLNNENIKSKLSVDGKMRLQRIIPILRNKLYERERYDFRHLVESAWILLGGPAGLNNPIELENSNVFFNLLTEMAQQDVIINLEKLKRKIENLYASSPDKHANLQIMTIHSAKGLEFDTVILPQLESPSVSEDKRLLQWLEQPLPYSPTALLLAPIHAVGMKEDLLYEYIYKQHNIKIDYEVTRLLYVATTRAKKRLHLFFSASEKEGTIVASKGSFLDKLISSFNLYKHEIQFTYFDEPSLDADVSALPKYIARLTSDWKHPLEYRAVKNYAYHADDGFQFRNNHPQILGIVVHNLLQQISMIGTAWWTSKTHAEQDNYLLHHLRQQGIAMLDVTLYSKLARKMLENTLQDERGLWIVTSQQEAKSEYAISTVDNGEVKQLIIDRTFVDADGTRWIIDYKTTTLNNADLEEFLQHEFEKYQYKMQLYAQALAKLDPKPIKLGLYFPALPAWKEWV